MLTSTRLASVTPLFCSIREYVDLCNNAGNPAAAHPFLRCYFAAWVYVAMATAGVSLLEKQRKYAEATDCLHQLLGEQKALLHVCALPNSISISQQDDQ